MKKLFFISMSIVLFSCSKSDDTYTPPIPGPEANTDVAFFKGEIDGATTNYVVSSSGNSAYVLVNDYYESGDDILSYNYGGYIGENSSNAGIEIQFRNMVTSGTLQEQRDNFYNTFSNIPTALLTESQAGSAIAKGITVRLSVGDFGYQYHSSLGSQAGSSFIVTSTSEATVGDIKTKTVYGTLNCKVYRESDESQIMTITNGRVKLVLKEFTTN